MPSPFPGMDPYLEDPDLWPDFHAAMIVSIRAALVATLPEGYSAFIDRNVWLHEPDSETRLRLGRPDVAVIGPAQEQSSRTATAIADAAPNVTTLPVERRQGNRYIKL